MKWGVFSVFITLIGISIVKIYFFQNITHEQIDTSNVIEVRVAGREVNNQNNWKTVSDSKAEQLILWLNQAEYVRKLDNPSTISNSVLIIELNAKNRKGEILQSRGEIIMVFNEDVGFQVHRGNDYYLAKHPKLKGYLDKYE